MTRQRINTMAELSKEIGVSRPTLSRYFHDPNSVRPSTCEKIRQKLAQVDYVPSFFATRMNRRTTGIIGVIIPHLSDLFYASLIESIELAARKAGFTTITQSSHGDPELEANALDVLRSMNADGVIVAPLGYKSKLPNFQAASSDLPFVFIDSFVEDAMSEFDFVGTDNIQSIATMVDYLRRTGDAPSFLDMPPLNSNAAARSRAYQQRMTALGETPDIISSKRAWGSWYFEDYGYSVMNEYFSVGKYTSATILCSSDRIAIGAIRAANQYGLFSKTSEAMGRLRIAGHDDHPLSRYMSPSLTTIAQDIQGIGETATQVLIERIRGEGGMRPVRFLSSAVLKVRESA